MVLIGLCVLLVLGLAWGFTRLSGPRKAPPSGPDAVASSPGSASGAHPTQLTPPPPNADTKTKLQAAQNYVDSKDYPMAEDIYKQILNSEPKNVDALQGLATVLYREDKIDEAAAILDRIPK
jgi:tetratricopeptide (TPR) repeat protein